VLEHSKKLPHRPGGAPRKLTLEQKNKASELVGIFMGRGSSFREALSQVARKFKVSPRTIQRAWQAKHRSRSVE